MSYGGGSKEIFGYKTLFREIGYYISRLEQYERSLKYFDEAISKTPTDRRALMGRAWARSKACKYEEALDDIRIAVNLDPGDLVMLAHRALNTYLNCEFEDGLVQNTRLMPKRKKPDVFHMGAMHCSAAIENCVGERCGHPLRDHYLIIRTLAWKKNYEERFHPKSHNSRGKKKRTTTPAATIMKSRSTRFVVNPSSLQVHGSAESVTDTIYSQKSEANIRPPYQKFPYRPLQRHTTNIQNYMAEKYLDSLYKDKVFLKTLSKKPGVESPNKGGTEKILQLAKTGYKTVKYKQELLRARRPFYFIKYQEVASGGGLKARQEEAFNKIRDKTEKDAQLIESKMTKALQGKQWRKVMELAEKLKEFCNSKSKKMLPNRNRHLMNIYDNVCQAHYDLKRLNPNALPWNQEKRVQMLIGIPLSHETKDDSVTRQFNNIVKNPKKEVGILMERLKVATCSEELCWIYYDLCRNYNDLKTYDLCRAFSKRLINEAKRINDTRWVINGLFESIRMNIAQKNKADAKMDCLETIEVAQKIGNDDLNSFCRLTLKVIEDAQLDTSKSMEMEERSNRLMSMMGSPAEAQDMIKRMSSIHKRMSVMLSPKKKEEEISSTKPIETTKASPDK